MIRTDDWSRCLLSKDSRPTRSSAVFEKIPRSLLKAMTRRAYQFLVTPPFSSVAPKTVAPGFANASRLSKTADFVERFPGRQCRRQVIPIESKPGMSVPSWAARGSSTLAV